jgi:Ca2+-binding EF-hand superfamily protein
MSVAELRAGETSNDWTHRRLVLASPNGPFVLDLVLLVDEQSLATAAVRGAAEAFATLANAPAVSLSESSREMMAESDETDEAANPDANPSGDAPVEANDAEAPSLDPSDLSSSADAAQEKTRNENLSGEGIELEPNDRTIQTGVGAEHDEVRQTQDRNESGVSEGAPLVAWNMLANSDFFRNELLPNLQASDEEAASQIIDKYDANKDGLADPGEFVEWLTRGLSRRESLIASEANVYRYLNRDDSPILRQIDIDQDGSLSAEEQQNITRRIRLLDRNNDFLVSLQEVIGFEPATQNSMNQQRIDLSPMLIDVTDGSSDRLFRRRIEDEYGSLTGFNRSGFQLRTALFDQLDLDQDGLLQRTEILELQNIPSELMLVVKFDSHSQALPILRLYATLPRELIQLQDESDAAAIASPDASADATSKQSTPPPASVLFRHQSFGAMAVTIAHCEFNILAVDPTERFLNWGSAEPWVNGTSIRETNATAINKVEAESQNENPGSIAPATSDSEAVRNLASQLGVTTDQSGDATARAVAFGRFGSAKSLDLDGDGEVTLHEIRRFVPAVSNATAGLARIRLADPQDAWFEFFDTDGNDVLTEIETDAVQQKLRQLRAARVGTEALMEQATDRETNEIFPADLPLPLNLFISRMTAGRDPFENGAIESASNRRAQQSDASTPAWFHAMDSNGDGFLARREFLGSPESFERLDVNADGILTARDLAAQ